MVPHENPAAAALRPEDDFVIAQLWSSAQPRGDALPGWGLHGPSCISLYSFSYRVCLLG